VWRSRVTHEEQRTVLVLDVPDRETYGGRVRTRTLTTTEGAAPMRTTHTQVLLTNWHHTFAYERDATADELADAGISAARETLDIPRSHPATLPVTPCSVVWSDGHPWVLDGEAGIPGPRLWVSLGHDGGPLVRNSHAMAQAGFSIVYVDAGEV
jgi:hypothetical protein